MTSLIDKHHDIPENATIRQEYIKCGNPDCKEIHKPHGPYLYAYWKENKKLKKKYVGKSWEEWSDRAAANSVGLEPAKFRKGKFVLEQAKNGNELAKEYQSKLMVDSVSVEWAYKKVRSQIEQQQVLAIYENIAQRMDLYSKAKGEAPATGEVRLTAASVATHFMLKAGLDVTNEQDIDKFLEGDIKELPKL